MAGPGASEEQIEKLVNEYLEKIFMDEYSALEMVTKLELVTPAAAEDDAIYTDENGAIYSL